MILLEEIIIIMAVIEEKEEVAIETILKEDILVDKATTINKGEQRHQEIPQGIVWGVINNLVGGLLKEVAQTPPKNDISKL